MVFASVRPVTSCAGMPAAAGMHLYANGYRPVMDALLPLLVYCVLPCVVLKLFCIEYSAKGAVELAVNIAVYAQRLGLDSSYAVQMVCLSTLLSLITLPVMLSLAAALGFA